MYTLFTGSADGQQRGQNLKRSKGPSPKGHKVKSQKVNRSKGHSKGPKVPRSVKRLIGQRVNRTKGQ